MRDFPKRRRRSQGAEVLEGRYALSAHFGAASVALDAFQTESPRIDVVEVAHLVPPATLEGVALAPTLKAVFSAAESSVTEWAPVKVAGVEGSALAVANGSTASPTHADDLPVIPQVRVSDRGRLRIDAAVGIDHQSFDLGSVFALDSFVSRGVTQQNGSYYDTDLISNDGRRLPGMPSDDPRTGTAPIIVTPDSIANGRPSGTTQGEGDSVVGKEGLPMNVGAIGTPTASPRGTTPSDTPNEASPPDDGLDGQSSSTSSRMLFGWTMPRLRDQGEEESAPGPKLVTTSEDQGTGQPAPIDLSQLLDRAEGSPGRLAPRYRVADTRDWMAVDIAIAATDGTPDQVPVRPSGILLGRYRRSDEWVADALADDSPASDQASITRQTAADLALVHWTPRVAVIPGPVILPIESVAAEQGFVEHAMTDHLAESGPSSGLMSQIWAMWDRAAWAFLGTTLAGLGGSLALAQSLESGRVEPPLQSLTSASRIQSRGASPSR